ncbi:MAG: biotin transporter BioY [Armatimonadota bacterium]
MQSISRVLPRAGIASQAASAVFFAALTAVCARISFHLWFTPIPVTLQVAAVLLSGLVLGGRLGAASMVAYLAMGLSGMPVFSGLFGPAAFAGPTGGYLFGFVAGAYIAGSLFGLMRKTPTGAFVSALAGVAAIYAVGAPWLGVWLSVAGKPSGAAWSQGIVPFIGVDILKALAVAGIAIRRRP